MNLVGDAAGAQRATHPASGAVAEPVLREDIEKNVAGWWEVMEAEALVEADPIKPLRLFDELSSQLPANATLPPLWPVSV